MSKFYKLIKSMIGSPKMILTYHRVNQLENDEYQLCISKESFYEQARYLKENYNMVFVEDLFQPSDRLNMALTFDDGYADNYYNLLPILEELKIPATIFVSTRNLDTDQEFWDDHIARIFRGNPKCDELNIPIEGGFFQANVKGEEKDSEFWRVHTLLKVMSDSNRDKFILELEKCFDGAELDGASRSLSIKELQSMAQSCFIRIGAHTVTHTQMSAQTYEEQMWEIKTSKEVLEKIINKQVMVFAYPFGGHETYNCDSIKILRELGFKFAVANFAGKVYRDTDVYQLPRIPIMRLPLSEFKRKIIRARYRE